MRAANTSVTSFIGRLWNAGVITMQFPPDLEPEGLDLLQVDFQGLELRISPRGLRIFQELIPMCDDLSASSKGKARLRCKRRIASFCGGYVI